MGMYACNIIIVSFVCKFTSVMYVTVIILDSCAIQQRLFWHNIVSITCHHSCCSPTALALVSGKICHCANVFLFSYLNWIEKMSYVLLIFPFDLMSRHILFYKLIKSGLHDRVINTLRSLYNKTCFRVKHGGFASESIRQVVGVNQDGNAIYYLREVHVWYAALFRCSITRWDSVAFAVDWQLDSNLDINPRCSDPIRRSA